MLRTAISRAGTSRLSSMVMPLVVALLSALPGCDKEPGQAERRYCDQSGCYACVGENCYPVPGDPTKPTDPPPGSVTTCDSDAICGAGRVCNLAPVASVTSASASLLARTTRPARVAIRVSPAAAVHRTLQPAA